MRSAEKTNVSADEKVFVGFGARLDRIYFRASAARGVPMLREPNGRASFLHTEKGCEPV